jgi:hypothetical protein
MAQASSVPFPLPAIAAAVVLRLALLAGAWLAAGPSTLLASDSASYLDLAAAIARTGSFTSAGGAPEIFRTPGYPALLAPGVALGHPVVFAIAAQLLLSACLVVVVHRAAWELADRRAASLCAMAIAVEPTLALWSVKVMPETLLALAVAVFARHSIRYLAGGDGRDALVAAVAICAGAYAKPAAYPLVVGAALVLPGHAVLGRRPGAVRKAALAAVVIAALLAPWHVRNAMATGYRGFSTLGAHAMYLSVGGSVAARRADRPFADERTRRWSALMRDHGAGARESPAAIASMWDEGRRALLAHPADYLAIHAGGMARTLLEPGAVEYLRLFGAYPRSGGLLGVAVDAGAAAAVRRLVAGDARALVLSLLLLAILLPYLVLPLVAARRLPRPSRPAFAVLAATALYFLVVSGGVAGSSRFRVPMLPPLVLMASMAAARRADACPSGGTDARLSMT